MNTTEQKQVEQLVKCIETRREFASRMARSSDPEDAADGTLRLTQIDAVLAVCSNSPELAAKVNMEAYRRGLDVDQIIERLAR